MTDTNATPRHFAIDVGGTFTDCLATTPDGQTLRYKLLSSGVTKGEVGAGSSARQIGDPARTGDPLRFWDGARLAIIDDQGALLEERTVVEFDGVLRLDKPLTDSPRIGARYELRTRHEAPVLAIRYLLELGAEETVPPVNLRLGTTRGTNSLLTRSGERCALVTTRGFGDLLRIGYQDRPKLFELAIQKPAPLTEEVIEIDARHAADGETLVAPDDSAIREQLQVLFDNGVMSLAICLLHADLYPEHEQLVERLAREVGFREVSRSSAVSPLVKLIARAETTLVDAYLNPVLREYLDGIAAALPGSKIRLMTSAGGLTTVESFRGCQSVLSGPAGGVVGYARVAELAGYDRAIGFDMGGTSTDVSRYEVHRDSSQQASQFEYDFEAEKAGVRLMTPTLAIETIAAGGGSICWFDGVKLRVGPASAGAEPGPACYGRGGPLTVTDLNLVLGRLLPGQFPFPLDEAVVRERLEAIGQEVLSITGEELAPLALAEGYLRIANANMAEAIRGVTVAKGTRPAGHVLVAFGGAAAQHACAVASELDVRQILHHPNAGILSAHGIALAEETRHSACGLYRRLAVTPPAKFEQLFAELEQPLLDAFGEESVDLEQLEITRTLELCYQGVDSALVVPYDFDAEQVADAFAVQHRQQFGYVHHGRPIEVAALRVEVSTHQKTDASATEPAQHRTPAVESERDAVFQGQTIATACYRRETLEPGDVFAGPALVFEAHTVVVVEPGWQAELLTGGELLLTHSGEQKANMRAATDSQAVQLEIFNNLLVGIAERMGHVLRRTSISVNVKERLDYSCAVFTAEGKLVANAPHVPVHLGAMGTTVRSVLADKPDIQSGDVFVSNDPYRGGSHLPDVTVVLPVFDEQTGDLLFCTACRAHHAEIGGVRPGSMPPASTKLGEEGVLISNFLLARGDEVYEDELRRLFSSGPYPTRRIEENLADLHAQVAAVNRGANDLRKLVAEYSLETVQRQMSAVQEAAETKVRQALAKFESRRYEFEDFLEDADGNELAIRVAIGIEHPAQNHSIGPRPGERVKKHGPGAHATFDFTGTAPPSSGNLNANRAIVTAAVLYVLRLLVDEDIPLNEGVLDAVEIKLPECLLNPPAAADPAESPAVAAGNVETSQRVVDVLLGAFGIAAASQGTMNNVLFGNERFGYYETLGGGSGASSSAAGADAVQVHMTNTRSTDPEILERRLPVRLWEMCIRLQSGGAGRQAGGKGQRRRLEFLEPSDLSLITERRGPHPPFGLEGGKPGKLGENRLLRADGTREALPGICQCEVEPGDVLEIETPGGGGFGVEQ